MKMMSFTLLLAVLVGLLAAARALTSAAAEALPPYPDGYRHWVHVKSALVSARHTDYKSSGGFRHIYANEKALSGYRTGKFPEGAIIVVDWLEGLESGGAFDEGPRRRVDVMIKDSRQYASTGGWGFERFKGDSRADRVVKAASTECFACHSTRKSTDLVFSVFRN